MTEVKVPTLVIDDKLPVVITVPLAFGKEMVLSSVGSIIVRNVSEPSTVEPSNVIVESDRYNPATTGDVMVLLVRVCTPEIVVTSRPPT